MTSLLHKPGVALVAYQARLTWRLNVWLALLMGLLLPVFLFRPPGPAWMKEFEAMGMGERFAPLLGVVVYANLLSHEWEQQGADLWLAKPFTRVGLLLARMLMGLVWLLLALLPMYGMLYITYVRFHWGEMLLVSLPTALFLGVLGMTVGLLVRNSAVAFLVPIAYWGFEETTDGAFTGPLFLFTRTTPDCSGYDLETCIRATASGPWPLTKLLLLGATLVLVGCAAWLLSRTGRRCRLA